MQNSLFYVFPGPHRMIVGFVFCCDGLATSRLIVVACLLFVTPHNFFLLFLVVKTPGGRVGTPTAVLLGHQEASSGHQEVWLGCQEASSGCHSQGIIGMPQVKALSGQLEVSLGHLEASSLFSGGLLACTDGGCSFSQVNCSFLLFFSLHHHTDKLIVVLFVMLPFLCFLSPLHSPFLFYPTSVTSWNLSSFFQGHWCTTHCCLFSSSKKQNPMFWWLGGGFFPQNNC